MARHDFSSRAVHKKILTWMSDRVMCVEYDRLTLLVQVSLLSGVTCFSDRATLVLELLPVLAVCWFCCFCLAVDGDSAV